MTKASAPNRFLVIGLLLGALAITYWLMHEIGLLRVLLDGSLLRERIAALGLWGPFAIIALMILAIMVSPLPSAPIAVAAGAAYGHFWGTAYVLVGAEAGAIAAFFSHGTLGLMSCSAGLVISYQLDGWVRRTNSWELYL